jgi:sugar phosphate isomerase/epimerase
VCSWSLQPATPAELIESLHATGVHRTQLALNPLVNDIAWADAPQQLKDGGIALVSGMMGFIGEDYSTLETIRDTGGVMLDEHWPTNLATAKRVAALAQLLGLTRVSFHAGFIPHDAGDANYEKLVGRVTTIADLFAEHGLDLLLETGQEAAESLDAFLDHADRKNLAVNFDPANMVLYGMGDPLAALRRLMPHVRQVHIKDALPAAAPGSWGSEVAVGGGAVDWRAFVGILEDAGYRGDLVIEREAGDQRIADIKTAARVLTALL